MSYKVTKHRYDLVTRKARLNENNLSGTYHLAELSLNKDLGTKICTAIVQKCDDKRYSYHSWILNLEKFFSDNQLQ